MISIRRSRMLVLLLFAVGVGVVGGWAAGHAQSDRRPAAQAPLPTTPSDGARLVPAALPLGASGSFAQVVETVGPAVININSIVRGGGGRTPVEEFFGDEFFRRFFGDVPERERRFAVRGRRLLRQPSPLPPAPEPAPDDTRRHGQREDEEEEGERRSVLDPERHPGDLGRDDVQVVRKRHRRIVERVGELRQVEGAAVKRMGAVSPAARDRPRMTPVRIPGSACGNT